MSSESPDRRVYRNPPIEEAVCEFRFADSEWDPTTPGRFFTEIQSDYPQKPTEEKVFETQLSAASPGNSSVSIKELPAQTRFSSSDGKNVLTLGPNRLSVSRLNPYDGWEVFRERLIFARRVLSNVVKPTSISRVGIRYINKVELSLDSKLVIDDYFTCAPQDLSEADFPNKPAELWGVVSRQEYSYGGPVRLTRMFATGHVQAGRLPFILDIDVYSEDEHGTEDSGIEETIDLLRSRERSAFEVSITEKLRSLFEPIS